MRKHYLSTWAHQRAPRDGGKRQRDLVVASSHLPRVRLGGISDEDLEAMKAAHTVRFDEDLPRTETLMAVAAIGYRMAIRDMKGSDDG